MLLNILFEDYYYIYIYIYRLSLLLLLLTVVYITKVYIYLTEITTIAVSTHSYSTFFKTSIYSLLSTG